MLQLGPLGPIRPTNQIQPSPRRRSSSLAGSLILMVTLVVCILPQPASASQAGAAFTRSATTPFFDCPGGACDAISDPPATKTASGYQLAFAASSLEGSGKEGGYDPKDLQSAYNIPATGGSGQTVAIVDAYGDSTANEDLEKYRSEYKLSECTEKNGCFKKINVKGEEGNYPTNSEGWGVETSLDLDMVSAACPECHILLVEASGELPAETSAAVNEAAKFEAKELTKFPKATEISNSYGYPETYEPWCGTTDCSEYSTDYNHSGVVVFASAGDRGYDNDYFGGLSKLAPSFPATSSYVVSVGGTSLRKAANSRGWSEKVWDEPESEYGPAVTGGGCSLSEAKPSWQTDSGCTKRTDNDVSAVAACETPVSIYSTPGFGGWVNECGTSASSPFLAGVAAHSGSYTRSLGADAFYKAGAAGKLFDVTEGSNGSCGESYLCTAKTGYDGPSGWGTPDGVLDIEGPPSATTEAATSVAKTEATLNGTVNPNGGETKYYFEYGLSKTYGSKTAEESAGSGTEAVKVSHAITGLTLHSTYHFRVVATNHAGTTYGADKVVFTHGQLPEFVAAKSTVAFTGESKEATFNGMVEGTSTSIKCPSSTSSGTLVSKSGSVEGASFKFWECAWHIGSEVYACTDPLTTHTVKGTLGFVKEEETGAVGFRLGEKEHEFLSYSCLGSQGFEGAVVAEIPEINHAGENQWNKSRSTFEVLYKATGVSQTVQTLLSATGYETGLHLMGYGGFFGGESSLVMTDTIKTAEAVELKT